MLRALHQFVMWIVTRKQPGQPIPAFREPAPGKWTGPLLVVSLLVSKQKGYLSRNVSYFPPHFKSITFIVETLEKREERK